MEGGDQDASERPTWRGGGLLSCECEVIIFYQYRILSRMWGLIFWAQTFIFAARNTSLAKNHQKTYDYGGATCLMRLAAMFVVWLLWCHKMYHQKYWRMVVVMLHIGLGFSSICVWSIWIVDFSVGNVGQHWAEPCYADSGTALAMWEGHYKFSLSKLFHYEGW